MIGSERKRRAARAGAVFEVDVLGDGRQERLIEAALGALELWYLVEAAAFELGARIGVKLPIGKLALRIADGGDEIVGKRAVEAFTYPGIAEV